MVLCPAAHINLTPNSKKYRDQKHVHGSHLYFQAWNSQLTLGSQAAQAVRAALTQASGPIPNQPTPADSAVLAEPSHENKVLSRGCHIQIIL